MIHPKSNFSEPTITLYTYCIPRKEIFIYCHPVRQEEQPSVSRESVETITWQVPWCYITLLHILPLIAISLCIPFDTPRPDAISDKRDFHVTTLNMTAFLIIVSYVSTCIIYFVFVLLIRCTLIIDYRVSTTATV